MATESAPELDKPIQTQVNFIGLLDVLSERLYQIKKGDRAMFPRVLIFLILLGLLGGIHPSYGESFGLSVSSFDLQKAGEKLKITLDDLPPRRDPSPLLFDLVRLQSDKDPFQEVGRELRELSDLTHRSDTRSLLYAGVLAFASDRMTGHWNDIFLKKHISGTFAVLGSYGGIALVAVSTLVNDDKERETARLALNAALDASLLVGVLKTVMGRERPYQSGNEGEFRGPGRGFTSFPSGHTALAFSLATVYARRHSNHRSLWYWLAGGVALARIADEKHFLSDTLFGAAIGIHSGNRALAGKAGVFQHRF